MQLFSRLPVFLRGLMALAVCLAASAAMAQQAAELAPADAGVYIEVANLAQLRRELADDPLVKLLQEQMPHRRQPQAWVAVQEAMGISGEEIFDRYFGELVVVIAERAGDRPPGLLLSKVSEDDAKLAVERLALEQVAQVNGFTAYLTSDKRGVFAFGQGWMAMADKRHGEYMRRVVEGIGAGDSLADDATFQQWMAKLPPEQGAVLFARDANGPQVHVMGVGRQQRNFTLTYAGKSPQWQPLLDAAPEMPSLPYGPLPASAIAAMSVNLRNAAPDPQFVAFMDRLLGGKSFEREVLPHIGTPSVLFVAQVGGDKLTPAIEAPVPAVGLALRMTDAAVAPDLQRAMDQLVVLFNLLTLEWGTPAAAMREVQHEGVAYRVAELGPALAQRLKMPQYSGVVGVSYGTVGEWFVVTSHPVVHQQCIEAAKRSGDAASPNAAALIAGGSDMKQPIAGAFVSTTQVGDLLSAWMNELREANPRLNQALRRGESPRPWRHAMLATEILWQYRLVAARMNQPEPGVVQGVIELQRK